MKKPICNWILKISGKKKARPITAPHAIVNGKLENMETVKLISCSFVQTDTPPDETEQFIRPRPGDVFRNCTFHVRKGRAAINFS